MAKLYKSTNDYKSFLGWYGECGDCSPTSIDDFKDDIYLVYEWSEGGYARKWKSSLVGTGLNSSITEFKCGHAYYIMLKKGEDFVELENFRLSTQTSGEDQYKDFGRVIDAEECVDKTEDETTDPVDENEDGTTDPVDENDDDTTVPTEEVGLTDISVEVDNEVTENNVTITVKLQKDENHWHYSINEGTHKMVYEPSATFTMQEGDVVKFYEVVVKDSQHTIFGEEHTYEFIPVASEETGMSFEIENSEIVGFKLRVKLKQEGYMKKASNQEWEMDTDTDKLIVDGDELNELIENKDNIKFFELRTKKNESFDKNTCYKMTKEKVFRYPPMAEKMDKAKTKRKKFVASNISTLTTEFIKDDGTLDTEEINNLIGETEAEFDINEVINQDDDVRMETKEKPIFRKVRDRMTILMESINLEELADEESDEDAVERHEKIMQRIRRPKNDSKKLFTKDSYKLMVDDSEEKDDFADSIEEIVTDVETDTEFTEINIGIYMENFEESVKRDFPEMGIMKENTEGKPPKRKRMSQYKRKSENKRKEMRHRRKEFAKKRECEFDSLSEYTRPSIMQGVFVDTIEIKDTGVISVKVTLLEGATYWAYQIDNGDVTVVTNEELEISSEYSEFDLRIFAVESIDNVEPIGRIFDKTIDTSKYDGDQDFQYEDKEDYEKPSYEGSMETIMVDDDSREYLVHVPMETDGMPLVINFHGFGGNAGDHMMYTKMNDLADSENFVVVYPQALNMQIGDKGAGVQWNVTKEDGKPDDHAFVDGIINEMSQLYTIDTNSVFVTGFSNGGMFAFSVATHMKEQINGIANVCGTSLTDAVNEISVLSIHGETDTVVPFDVNQIRSWATANSFDNIPTEFNSPEKYENDTVAIEIHSLPMGHVWREGSNVIGGKSINKYIYDFFMSSKSDVVVEENTDENTIVDQPDNSNMNQQNNEPNTNVDDNNDSDSSY